MSDTTTPSYQALKDSENHLFREKVRLERSRRRNIRRAWRMRWIITNLRLRLKCTEEVLENWKKSHQSDQEKLAASRELTRQFKEVAEELYGFIKKLSVYREYEGWLYPNEAIYHGSHPIPEAALAKLEALNAAQV